MFYSSSIVFLVTFAVTVLGGLGAYVAWRMLREWAFPREIGVTIRGLSKTTVAVLALGAAVAVLQGGAKSRAPARHAPMAQSAPGDGGESSGQTEEDEDSADGDQAAITAIAVTNGVEMVLHRPSSSSADAAEVVVCAATNLVTTNWFPVATATFAAGETDVPVALSPARLAGLGISGSCFLRFLESGDSDGDGLETWYERLVVRTDPHCADSDRDGLPDGDEIVLGLDPNDSSDGASADAAVLRVEVTGTSAADLLVDGVPRPLVVSEDRDAPVLVRVPRGRVVSLSLRASPRATAVPSVAFGSDDFAYGSLPSSCGSDGWIVFPRTDLTPVCIHGIGHVRTVGYDPGVEDPGLASVWTDAGCPGLVFEDVRPRSVSLRALSRRPSGSVGCTLSHPLQLFGPRLIETPVRCCPRPGSLPDPGCLPWFDPSVGGSGDYVGPPRCPCGCGCEVDRCDCGCLDEDSGGPCSCRSWGGSAGAPDPDDPIESPDDPRAADLSPLPDVLYLHRGHERRFRVDVPAGRAERCSCDCPEHALHHVSVLGDERLRVAGPDGSACYELYTTAVVRVSGRRPSLMVGDAPLTFSLDGEPYEARAFTVLGLDVTHPNLDLDELERMDSSFGVPMVATEDPERGLPLELRTDVHVGFGTVRLALEAGSGRFQLHASPEGIRPREVLLDSRTNPEVRMPIPDWWVFAGMGWSLDDPDFPVVVTASEPGTCRLVFSYYGVVGDRYVMCTKTRRITAVAPPLLADHDRNGGIDGADAALQAAGAAFRFWFNEDVDKGDFVGQNPDVSPNWDADPALARVKGRLDLVNLFPVRIDVSAFRRAWGGAATFRLRRESPFDRLRYCRLAGVSPDRADAIQTEEVLTASGGPLETAALHPLDPAGEEIGEWLDEDGRAMLAFMAGGYVDEWSCPELVVELGGRVVYCYTLPLSICSVREMYNWVNSRHLSDEAEARPTWLGAPSCGSGKTLVFLHGANVGEDDAGKWGDALYKRLWWAGADVDFYNVDWRSDIGSSANYHENASNAFAVAERLASTIAAIPGRKTIMAHSLGNMVVSSMIQDHGLQVEKYLMFNSAVPAEAYDPDPSLRVPQLVHPDWEEYPTNTWTASYHSLFDGFPDDDRRHLGWPGRFVDVAQYAVNFYSTGDEVLEMNDSNDLNVFVGILSSLGRYSWHKQELFKGRGIIDGLGGTDWSGWGFNGRWRSLHPAGREWEIRYTSEQASEFTPEQLRTEPVFYPYPLSVTNSVIPMLVRAAHLTKGVPALTPATGRTAFERWSSGRTLNLGADVERPHGWPVRSPYGTRWLHSDMKDVALWYSHKLFEKIIEVGGLR